MRLAGVVMMAAVLAGCAGGGGSPPQKGGRPSAQKASGGKTVDDERVDPSVFVFEDPVCQKRYKALRAYCLEQAASGGWNYLPTRKLGNFLEDAWCRAPEPDWNCFSGYAEKHLGTQWFRLSVLYYDKDWPKVFGLNVSAGSNARDGQWGVHFYYAAQGKSVVGSGFGLSFLLYKEGEDTILQEINLGYTYSYDFGVTNVRIEAPGGQDAEMARLYASPQSLKETAVARYDALLEAVEATAREHRGLKRVYGEYKGRGIPPMHEDVPMSPEEEKVALEKARKEIGDLRKAVEQNHAAFHKLLTQLLPYDRCWK